MATKHFPSENVQSSPGQTVSPRHPVAKIRLEMATGKRRNIAQYLVLGIKKAELGLDGLVSSTAQMKLR